MKENPNNRKTNSAIDRRIFLKASPYLLLSSILGGYTVFDIYKSHILGQLTALTNLWETIEATSALDSALLEKNFNVSLFNPQADLLVSDPSIKNILGEKTATALIKYNPNGILTTWDLPRISLLNEVLKELPPNFYTSKKGKTTFILWKGEGMARRKVGENDSFRGRCVCSKNSNIEDNYPPAIITVKRDLRTLYPQDRIPAKRLLAHELSHLATLTNGVYFNERNVLIDKAMAAIGVNPPSTYDFPDPNLTQVFKNHVNTFFGAENRGTQIYLKEDDLLGTSIIPQEFIANAIEVYFIGKTEFFKTYMADLGTTKTNNLYTFIKENIFFGNEYSQGFKIKTRQ